MTPTDKFMADCSALACGTCDSIDNLRARATTEGPSAASMRLVARVMDVKLVRVGKELKAVRAYPIRGALHANPIA